MDLVNIIYRYVNRFINSEKLINLLENLDKKNYSTNELKEIEKLLEEVKEIVKTTPIKIDDMEIRRLASLDYILKKLKKIKINNKKDDKVRQFVKRTYNGIIKRKKASKRLWTTL